MTDEKNIEFNGKKYKKVFEKGFKWIGKKIKTFGNYLKRQKVLKIVGFILVLLSVFSAFVETIILALIHSDREKFAEILKYFYNFNLFDYLKPIDFYLISGGGYLIDLFWYLLVFLLGILGGKNKNYFKKSIIRIILALLLGLGILIFSFGFYRAMPKIMIPLNKIAEIEELYEAEDFDKEIKDNGIIEKRNLRNGYEERGYLDRDNLKAYYNYINMGW